MNLLKYDMKQAALQDLKNNVTIANYKKHIDRFCEYAKATFHIRLKRDIEKQKEVNTPIKLIQKYEEYLEKENLSPATIHTYLAPVCKAFSVDMQTIKKPRRSAGAIKKCRDVNKNPRGQNEAKNASYQQVVCMAKATGLRRDELKNITANALQKDVCGYDCLVVKGKGGKVQWQRILPNDLPVVRSAFAGKKGNEKIFSTEAFKNHISIHTLRAEHARDCYDYYLGICRKGGREQLKKELLKTFDAYHVGDSRSKRFTKQREIFIADMDKDGGKYHIRGDNVQRAKAAGRPLVYDRVALMCTSVWHLAHWRVNVTVTNYML